MIALFLNDNISECRRVLDSVKKIAKDLKPFELNELILFETKVFRKENKI